jgi:hypothetical protein
MPAIREYRQASEDYKVGQIVRVKAHSQFAHLAAGSLRVGRIEKVEPSRLLVRLKHDSFWLHRDDLVQS